MAQPGVDAVAQREVDDAVWATKVNGRFRAFLGQRVESLSGAAREENDEDIVEIHNAILCRFRGLTCPGIVPMIGRFDVLDAPVLGCPIPEWHDANPSGTYLGRYGGHVGRCAGTRRAKQSAAEPSRPGAPEPGRSAGYSGARADR